MSEKVREIEDTVFFGFAANDTSGSAGDGATPAAHVRRQGDEDDAAPILSPTPALLSHETYPAGNYEVAIEATEANGFAAGADYAVYCTLVIDEENPTGLIGEFRLEAQAQAPNTVAAIQAGLSTFDASTDEVDVGAVNGVAVAGVNDFKATGFSTHSAADVWTSGTRTLSSFGTLVADVAAAVWAAAQRTLTAFGFTVAAEVDAETVTAAVESALAEADLLTSDDLASAITPLALEATLDDLPAATVAAIGVAHGSGRYDQTGTPVARIVSARVLASEDRLVFYRDETPQEVLICVSPAVDLSSWDLWLTIKPPSARDDADNDAALCEIEGVGDTEGRISISVTAADIEDMTLGRAYDFSIEGKSGVAYRLFARGTCQLTHNVRRNVEDTL